LLRGLLKLTALKLALAIGLLFAGTHLVWKAEHPPVFPFTELDLLDAKARDIKFRRRGPVPSSGKVTIAAIDEASIQRYGLWPWKRVVIARALENLHEAGAAAIGVDIAFTDEDRSSPHLAVNQVLDEIAARASVTSGAAQRLEALATRAPAALGAELQALKEAALREAEALASVRELAASRRMEEPDRVLAETLAASPRVVLAVLGLIGADTQVISEAERARSEKVLERFFLNELFDSENKVPDSEGRLIYDWSPVYSSGLAEIEVIERLDAVQAPLSAFAEAVGHVGLMDAIPDPDGSIRTYGLLRRVGDRMLPGLALATAAAALDARIAPFSSGALAGGLEGVGLMRGDKATGLRKLVPVDPWNGLYLINYPGPARPGEGEKAPYTVISLADVVDGRFDQESVRDKVVLVGVTAVGTHDLRVTPYDSNIPGIYTHAAVIDNILSGDYFVQGAWLAMFEIALLLALSLAFGLIIRRFRIRWQITLMIGAIAAFLAIDLLLFKAGVVLTTVMPLLEMATLSFAMVVFSYVIVDREKRQVRTAFQYYLTKSVMEEMLKNPDKLKLGGDKRDMTVLFSDIRGFTSISERLPPEDLVRLLNEYLTPMTEIVFRHEGTLDKYMGDAIMAIWGAPLPQEDHALRACAAAIQMLEALDELRKRWCEQGLPAIDIGIGINSGPMAVGNMGSDMRFDYTVMGDNVNLGSRLEGTNKEYGTRCIISELTYAQVKGKVVARELGSVRVKGKKLPVVIYELRALGSPSPEQAKTIADFEAGVAAYRAQRWDEAETRFGEVLASWPHDGPSAHYLEDIEHKRRTPPPEGWDGVYEMKTK
jgi:adenylate cyclase